MRKRVTFRSKVQTSLAILLVYLFVVGSLGRAVTPAEPESRSSTPINVRPDASGRSHYLLLVNTAFASDMSPAKIAQFGRSAYEGLAVAFSGTYDASPPPDVKNIETKLAEWKKITDKQIWPWVFLNRIIAVDPKQNNPHTLHELYYHRIRGLDLENVSSAREDFLRIWGNSLRAARDSGTPGIFCDLEFYNNYAEYDPRQIAQLIGKSPQETIALLQRLGARMADVAASEYPNAILWFAFTGLSHPGYNDPAEHFNLAPAYISMGMLDEIQSRHFRLHVISGGEVGLEGYCHPSLTEFQNQIGERATAFAPYLRKYGSALELAGTMTLWSDRKAATGDWVHQGDCGACPAGTVEELQPYIELILKTYRYNWIWGSNDAGYAAFDSRIAPRFDSVIANAKAHASKNE